MQIGDGTIENGFVVASSVTLAVLDGGVAKTLLFPQAQRSSLKLARRCPIRRSRAAQRL
ncbi:hypothetical protein ACQ5SK_14975 [Bradyrhizobium japonicum]